MAGDLNDIRSKAVLLRDDSVGVSTENKPRKIQRNGSEGVYYSTISPDWLEQLNLAEQSEPTLHSLSLGIRPVIVQNPAIIIQPASILGDEFDD